MSDSPEFGHPCAIRANIAHFSVPEPPLHVRNITQPGELKEFQDFFKKNTIQTSLSKVHQHVISSIHTTYKGTPKMVEMEDRLMVVLIVAMCAGSTSAWTWLTVIFV
jgi:hypothetical protein